LILKEKSPISRSDLVKMLVDNKIECRPIVTGNFLKNVEVLKYFYYEISGTLENSDYIDKHGLFVGNHHVCIGGELDYLFDTLKIF
jgi:GDP-4-dehydro-6-deoxy-alpha-D-mannose 3-dehydratase